MIKIKAKIKPGSFKNEINFDGEFWCIKIKAKPINGEANKYLINYLAEELKISKSLIEIEKGNNIPFKTIKLNITDKVFHQMLNQS